MAKPVSARQVAQVIRDAKATVVSGLPVALPEAHAAVLAVVVREFLDSEYVMDLEDPEERR